MTKAQALEEKRKGNHQQTLKVTPDQPNNIANFVVLNEKATANLLKGEKIDLQMNGRTLLDVFLTELTQLKNEQNSKDSLAHASNQQGQPLKIVVEHVGLNQTGG